ncbi:hypothetical protein B296_00027002 [Ensete ventricosum]|uniref:Uncharacterized protein n=1 Tax=Ensete ventricosum TaxID=4639 RepID=A0A427AQM8_ENSVE|nr:hypothetical protein B296_00027002 [Ensete ventricosum]
MEARSAASFRLALFLGGERFSRLTGREVSTQRKQHRETPFFPNTKPNAVRSDLALLPPSSPYHQEDESDCGRNPPWAIILLVTRSRTHLCVMAGGTRQLSRNGPFDSTKIRIGRKWVPRDHLGVHVASLWPAALIPTINQYSSLLGFVEAFRRGTDCSSSDRSATIADPSLSVDRR